MYSVYWIRYSNHTDPHKEGYIGISKCPSNRFKEHIHSRNNKIRSAIKKGADIEIIKSNLSLNEALSIEKTYRSEELIGWNLCEGGQMPPSKKGHIYETGKQILTGDSRTGKQKAASKNHSKKMKGRTPWNKGQTGFTGPIKPCVYKDIEFNSRTEAAKHFNVSVPAVTHWIKKHKFQAGM